MAGRRTKYTEETVTALTTALAAGATIQDACVHAGISDETYANWCAGKLEFLEAVKKAQAQARIGAIARIQKAGRGGTWQADAWYLERTDSANYGRKDTIKIEGGIDVNLVNELVRALKEADFDPAETMRQMIEHARQQSVRTNDTPKG